MPPYALSNPRMFDFMINEAGQWYICGHCQAAAKHHTLHSRSSSWTTVSTNYIRDLLACTSLDLALLSKLTVALQLSARWHEFLESTVSAYPMLQAAIPTHSSADAHESLLLQTIRLRCCSASCQLTGESCCQNRSNHCSKHATSCFVCCMSGTSASPCYQAHLAHIHG